MATDEKAPPSSGDTENSILSKALQIEIHPKAKQLALECVDSYSTALIVQAKLIAYRDKAGVVIVNHVQEASEIIKAREKQSTVRELLIIIGSAFFGAFIQGFITELSTGNRTLIVIYTILGFLGISMVFFGFRQRS